MLDKIFKVLLLAFFICSEVSADEGMWLPLLLKELNETDMQNKGLKLSAEDIYSVNKSSLKDAIVHFNGGCTGEIISADGLLITNHHCGYGQIQAHSSVSHDYLTDGFWAMSRERELPNEELYVTFIVRMDNVTEKVMNGITESMAEKDKRALIESNIEKIKGDAIQETHYEAIVKSFFEGNEYYLFITETYNDIRLVGAPPSSVGKFGGDTDNWMWPRHTGDFSIFRIYAGKDNKPAKYSADNVPFKPKHHLPINMGIEKEGDFTMVYGFPGRTQQYLVSHAVDYIVNVRNPAKINFREEALTIMNSTMRESDKVRIQYASKYARISNYYKKWQGESRGLKKLDAIETKMALESKFNEKAKLTEEHKKKYGHVIEDFKGLYEKQRKYALARDYYTEFIYSGSDMMRYTNRFRPVVGQLLSMSKNTKEVDKAVGNLKLKTKSYFKNMDLPTEKQLFSALLKIYYENLDPGLRGDAFSLLEGKYKLNYEKFTEFVYSKSMFVNQEKVNELLNNMDESAAKKIQSDVGYQIMDAIASNYYQNIRSEYVEIDRSIKQLNRLYVEGLQVLLPDYKKYYPDANSTLRLTYGKVEGSEPMDGVVYDYYTTIDGMMEKYDSLDSDFVLPSRLIELFDKKDFGEYGVKDELRVCFTASNHTTGGNSGSPVLNGEGHLIGVNFDRSWESTMSDIMFDPDRCRNIVVDMNYVLFIIDKYANAGHLLEEMTLIK